MRWCTGVVEFIAVGLYDSMDINRTFARRIYSQLHQRLLAHP